MKVIVMRHAKSDWSGGVPDIERPLNPRGQRAAEALGMWLKREGHVPDEILCSSATRTQETCARLNLGVAPKLSPDLYHAEPDILWQALHGASGSTVLILAHNPGIAFFASDLVKIPPDHSRFDDYPTGATLVAELDGPWTETRPGMGRVLDFVVPKDL